MNNWKSKMAKKITQATYSPPLVLQSINNLGQGGFNFSGATCYRNIEKLAKYERGFLFSKGLIVRASRYLENEAKKIINWNLVRNEGKIEQIEYINPGKYL